MSDYKKQRQQLMEAEQQIYFAHDVEMTPDELKANEKLKGLRHELYDKNFNVTIHGFYE